MENIQIQEMKKIATPKVGDKLSLALNYIKNEIELFHNDIKLSTFTVKHLRDNKDIKFYPTFQIMPYTTYIPDDTNTNYSGEITR